VNERTDGTQVVKGARSGGYRRTCLSSEEAERSAGNQVALKGEGVVDSGLSGECFVTAPPAPPFAEAP
jgi:hypothetical protein